MHGVAPRVASRRSLAITVGPSIPGRLPSTMIADGRSCPASLSPSSPIVAHDTSYPASRRRSERAAANVGPSSMTSTCPLVAELGRVVRRRSKPHARAVTSAASYGFPTYSSAPVESPRTRSRTSASVDSSITGSFEVSLRSRNSASKPTPSPSGRSTSSTTRSTDSAASTRRASRRLDARIRSKPPFSNASDRSIRTVRLSSTINTRFFIGSPPRR